MPDTFTPEQISQILEEFFKVVGTRQYIGARYVPIFGRKDEESIEWDNTGEYEPLTIVLYQGNSYTSRQFVPVGVEITNQEFWAITGNYNAQVEMYRRETAAAREIADNALEAANNAQVDIDTLLPKSYFAGEETTVKDYIDSNIAGFANKSFAFNTVQDMQDNESILYEGAICKTNGFYSNNDGGYGWYLITTTSTIANGMDIININDRLNAVLIHDKAINVKQLGAHGNANYVSYDSNSEITGINGWFQNSLNTVPADDDTKYFNRAIELIEANPNLRYGNGKIVIPTGAYLISSCITISDGIEIEGIGPNGPRYGAAGNTATRKSVAIVCDNNFTDDALLHFVGVNHSISNIEIVGNSSTIGIKLGTYGTSDSHSLGGTSFFNDVTVTNNIIGVAGKEYSYTKYVRCYFACSLRAGALFITCGDSSFIDCVFNRNGYSRSNGTGIRYGVGLYFDVNCSNTNVTGGKVENNNVGIYVHSDGININGIQFDNNKLCNLAMYSNDISCVVNVTGNRFLGGGYDETQNILPAHIIMYGSANSLYRYPLELTLTGNSFKAAMAGIPYSNAANLEYSKATRTLIYCYGEGIHRIIAYGNDHYNSGKLTNDVYGTGNNNERSYISSDSLVKISNFKGSIYNEQLNKKFYVYSIADTDSVVGNFNYGDIITTSSYEKSSGVTKWLCVRPGSQYTGSINDVFVSGDAGNNYIVSNASVLNKLYPYDVIRITGDSAVLRQITFIDYANNTIYLDSNLSQTITNAPVAFAQPMFRAVETL